MASYKSLNTFEGQSFGNSGSGRSQSSRRNFGSMGSLFDSNNNSNHTHHTNHHESSRSGTSPLDEGLDEGSHSIRQRTHYRPRVESSNAALLDDPLTQPHSFSAIAHSSSVAEMMSTSILVREHSLALGNLERKQSFDLSGSTPLPTTAAAIAAAASLGVVGMNMQQHSEASPSWVTASEAPSSLRTDIAATADAVEPPPSQQQQQQAAAPQSLQEQEQLPSNAVVYPPGHPLAAHRQTDKPDRSPPSGLSLLLRPRNLAGGNGSMATGSQAGTGSVNSISGEGMNELYGNHAAFATAVMGGAATLEGTRSPSIFPSTTGPFFGDDTNAVDGEEAGQGAKRSGIIHSISGLFSGSIGRAKGSETARLLRDQGEDMTGGATTYGSSNHRHGRNQSAMSSSASDHLWANELSTAPHWKQNLVHTCLVEPLGYIPAVLVGLLLNLLDAVTFGMIIFPLNMAPFQALGPDGISMFFVSCIISQLTYSLGGSIFKGATGGMMIEVVPFLHLMAEKVVERVGVENRAEVLATTIMSFAISSLMTGAVFMALGAFKLGSLVAFFPRHILVGCIGGVGWFLFVTGIEISSRMTTALTYTFATLQFLFRDMHTAFLWTSALALAILLRLLQYRIRHPFLVPLFFLAVPLVFYGVVAIGGYDLETLRDQGWIFSMPKDDAPGWRFYSYYDFRKTDWGAVMDTVPAMMALTFFGILHVPINVPALGVSTGVDNYNINRELVAHGWSNLLSGFAGSVQNYLVYTNSLLFIKSGGNSRVAGVMLAMATLVIYLVGPWIVGYIPVMVVGSLIFHLGIDLMKEALWDTWGLVHPLEYLTIASIVVAMAGLGFVEGILLGVLLACVLFVVSNSRKTGVRYACTGESAKSTVRRVYRQQMFLRQVGRQIYIFKLQGDMFFGTINKVEKMIQEVFSRRRWEISPIQFLILDFSLVRGVDFSAAEGFGRIRRAVRAKGVRLVLSGLDETGDMGRALRMVGVWGAGAGAGLGQGHGTGSKFNKDGYDTKTFPGLSEALEHCENCLLEAFYHTRSAVAIPKNSKSKQPQDQNQRQQQQQQQQQLPQNSQPQPQPQPQQHQQPPHDASPPHSLGPPQSLGSVQYFDENHHTPRTNQLFSAGRQTLLARERTMNFLGNLQEPVPTLLAAFNHTRENSTDFYWQLGKYFKERNVSAGSILWRQGEQPIDGICLVQDGSLRSVQEMHDSGMVRRNVEVILSCTITGEMELFTGNVRASTVVADKDVVLWCLSRERFQTMIKDEPALAVELMRIAMSYSAERLNTIAAYAFSLS